MSDKYRNIDGSENNSQSPEYGQAGQNFIRKLPSDYGDGLSTLAGSGRPSPREISNELHHQEGDIYNSKLASNYLWAWGQFLDHDIDLTREGDGSESAPISVPTGDPYFDPFYTGSAEIPLHRSDYDTSTGTTTPREQVNDITAYIDASNVYGSSPERAEWLRTEDGKLKTSEGDFLPYNDGTQDNAGGPSSDLFVAGDVRANENVVLTSLHTLFVREHNRLVDELSDQHPDWNSDMLYNKAKMIVEAEIQSITYNEYLPMLLGQGAIADYQGYDPSINAQIANVFATAAFRLGHTQLSPTIYRMDEYGNESSEGHLGLRDAFFHPDKMAYQGGPGEIFRGIGASYAQEVDLKMIDDVRNFLFGPPGAGGLDLASLNIQRGREHGLPDYNTAREGYGLKRVESFDEITSNVDVQNKLKALYGSVDNIDIFVGGLAEDHVTDSMVGELFHAILVDQFTRLRDGDSYFYEARLEPEWLEYVNGLSLADIIKANTDVDYLQHNVFEAYNRMAGSETYDDMQGTETNDLMMGFKGHDEMYGNQGNDDIYGGKGHDYIEGGQGKDYLYGEEGHDELYGNKGHDYLDGGKGHDYLKGGKGDDHLKGGQGHDELFGNKGNDYLDGGKGYDILKGGQGNDTLKGGWQDDDLWGGKGADTFVFDIQLGADKLIHLLSNDHDTIHDFNAQEGDKVVFANVPNANDDGKLTTEDIFDHVSIHDHGDHSTIEFAGGGTIEIKGQFDPDQDSTVIV